MGWMIFFNVFMRYFLNKPLAFVEEYSGQLFVFIVFIGLSYATRKDSHVQVDLFYKMLPHIAKKVLDIVTLSVSLLVAVIYFYFSFDFARYNFNSGETSIITYTPIWIPSAFVVIGLLFFILEIFNQIIQAAKKLLER
jgi:TRAP-type C4-dicarboxylate transport system permease small subunit